MIRAIRSKVVCDKGALEAMWRTHLVYNQHLIVVVQRLNQLKRGADGAHPDHAKAYVWGLLRQGAKYAYDRIIKAASGSAKNGTARNWFAKEEVKIKDAIRTGDAAAWKRAGCSDVDSARELLQNLTLYREAFGLFVSGWRPMKECRERLECLPKHMESRLYQEAVAIISGHEELTANWRKAHADWCNRKEEWEKEHQRYMALRPRFDAFEREVGGKVGKRRGRWHRYMDWLAENPDLAAWRQDTAAITPIPAAKLQQIRNSRRSRQLEAEAFWELNPELAELDRLHGQYEREFVRRGKRKCNPDGFKHRPTFTLPHAVKHPRWFVFSAPQTNPPGWRNLTLPASAHDRGAVDLYLLVGEPRDGKYPAQWLNLEFQADPRMADFREIRVKRKAKQRGTDETVERDGIAYRWFDRQLGIERDVEAIGGTKLMFDLDGQGRPTAAHLVFACNIVDEGITDLAKSCKYEEFAGSDGSKSRRPRIPAGLRTFAVDLDTHGIGFASLAEHGGAKPSHDGVHVLRAVDLDVGLREPSGVRTGFYAAGPQLGHIGLQKRDLKHRRRMRGKPIKGERSHVELQQHVDHMSEDRFKKAARAIVNAALGIVPDESGKRVRKYPRADILLLEKLENLVPDGEKEHGINRALLKWNRGQLVEKVRQLAPDVGLRVYEVWPVGTSQICSKCGALGRRYSIVPDSESKEPSVQFGEVKRLFACERCRNKKDTGPLTCNADYNASVNLHRRFALGDAAVANYVPKSRRTKKQQEAIRGLETRLLPELQRLHGLGRSESYLEKLETPF